VSRGQVNIGRRFMWWAPWGVTRPWLPRVFRGSNEWCSRSVAVVLPFLGAFIWFWEPELRTMPCGECWDSMCEEQRADYLPGGHLEGGVVHQDRAGKLFAAET
jgi:sterol desaturase/sphingolipid hydroxylase (fatty acid hydroxylase superfamily)